MRKRRMTMLERFTRAARTDFKIDPRTDKVTIVLSSDHLNGNIRIALEKILNRPGDDELNEWRRTSQPGKPLRPLLRADDCISRVLGGLQDRDAGFI